MCNTPHTSHGVLYSVKTLTGRFKPHFVIMGFIATFLLFSCNEPTNNANQLVEDASTENRSFCNPAGGSNCDPPVSHSMYLTVSGCQIKVNFKSRRCWLNLSLPRIDIYDFSIDWANSLPCTKIGLLNNAIPINGIGDWTPFFTLYNDLYRSVSNAAELFVLSHYGASEAEDHTLDWWESHCQKVCYAPELDPENPEDPQIPQWSFHTCSTEGCCFRRTIYTYNSTTKKFEVYARNVTPGGVCLPEIPVNCVLGGSECVEPCAKL